MRNMSSEPQRQPNELQHSKKNPIIVPLHFWALPLLARRLEGPQSTTHLVQHVLDEFEKWEGNMEDLYIHGL